VSERSVSVRLLAITSQYDTAMKNSGRVTTDLGTQAQLSGTKVEGLGRSTNQAGNEATLAEKKFRGLLVTVAALGPALVPLGSAAIVGGAAFGVMGAAGIAAFKGIKNEIALNTQLGQVYAGQLEVLKGNLADLEHAAASGMLGPFEHAVGELETQMPFLLSVTREFSTILGVSGDNLLEGVIDDVKVAMPLLTRIAQDAEGVTQRFRDWSANGGLENFVDYAQRELPVVEHVLGEVAQAVEHVVEAVGPLGGIALGELGLVARAINALPLPVLQALIPLLVQGYLAMKAYEGLKSAINVVDSWASKVKTAATVSAAADAKTALAAQASAAAQTAAAAEEAAAAKLAAATTTTAMAEASAAYLTAGAAADEAAAMTTAADAEVVAANRAVKASMLSNPLTAIVVGVTTLVTALSFLHSSNQQAIQDEGDFKQALIESKGAIDANVISTTALKLQQDGLADKAGKAGVSLGELTTGITGTDEQFAQLLRDWGKIGDPSTIAKLFEVRNAFDAGKLTAQQYADAMQSLGANLNDTSDSTHQLAQTTQQATDAADSFTTALEGVSTASGGDVIRSQDALQKQLNAVADALHTAKGAIDQYSNAGLDSRDAIDQSATSAQAYAASVYKQTGSINDAVTAYDAWYVALVNTAKSQGLSKAQLDAYLASVGQLPSQVNQALATMTTVGQNASINLVNGASSGVNSNAGRLTAIGAAAGANVGFGFTTSLFSAVNNAFAAIGTLALTARGGSTSSTFNEQVPGTATSTVKAYVPPKLAVGSTSPVIKGGTYTPPKAASGGSKSAKTPAQTAHDNAVAADDLWAAKALAAISPTNKLALAQEAVTEAQRRLANETTKGTTEYYQDLTKLHQAQSDLTAEVLAEAQARADAQKQLAADEKSYADLLGKEADTTAKYYADLNSLAAAHAAKDQQLLAQRQSDIEGFASANQKAVIQWGSSLSFLSSNVEDQADQITKWSKLLAEARAKGVSEAVISALGLDQGPQALGQLEQFSNATQDQIDALNKAVADKNAAAGQEVTTEAANNYGALGQALLAEQQSYADSVKALQTQFIADMAELAKEAQQAQTAINGDKATMVNGVYTDTATGRAAFYGPNGEPGSATKTAYYSASYVMPDGRTAWYHPASASASYSAAAVPSGKSVAFSNSIAAQVAPTFLSPDVHVYIGDTELKGMVRVEMSQANAAKKQAILVGGAK
jgi:hypothetical protein